MNTLPPDPHLQAALRHAPDAERSAPPELSAQILATAHRSATQRPASAAPAKPPPGLGAWWAIWTRPGPRAAFATLLMVGFVGLLWRDETPGPAVDGPSAAMTPIAAAPASPPSAASPAAAAVPVAPAELPAPAAARERSAMAAKPSTAAPAKPAAEAPAQAPVPAAVAEPSPPTQDTPPVGRALAEAATKPAPLRMRPDAAESVAVAATPSPAATPPATARTARLLAAPSFASSSSAAGTNAASDLLRPAPPWAEQALPASRWQQGEPSGAAVDTAWLLALARTTQGRWQPAADGPPADAAPMLLGLRGESERGRLWLEAGAVLWCPTAGPCQRAVLSPTELRALRGGLQR
jgi:hypothetical protein